jgi:predicted nuclease of predicted toxin-antitoxin system
MTAAKRKTTIRRGQKPKLLLDEGLSPRTVYAELNRYCDVKHVKHDLHLGGLADGRVYDVANKESRLLVTFNVKDFKSLVKDGNVSVIGISTRLTNKQIDRKLMSTIKRLQPSEFEGVFISITNETKKQKRR